MSSYKQAQMDTRPPLDKQIQVEIAENIRSAKQSKANAQAMAKALQTGRYRDFISKAVAMRGETVNSYSFTGEITTYIGITVSKLQGFTDSRLLGILEAFEYMDPRSTSITEQAVSRTKTISYWFSLPYEPTPNADAGANPRIDLKINIEASVIEDSATCKQVVVGYTKVIEPQPIYKLECDSEAELTVKAS